MAGVSVTGHPAFAEISPPVLLIERRYYKPDSHLDPLKLPGSMILENETLPEAAYRVLEETTGLKEVYLKEIESLVKNSDFEQIYNQTIGAVHLPRIQ